MIDFPREVREGDRVSATEFNRVVRALRRLWPIKGPGIKLSSSPNGTVFASDPTTHSVAYSTSSDTVYGIATDNSGIGGVERTHFINRYFEISGVIVEGPDADITSSAAGSFIAIRISNGAASIQTYGTLAAMQNEMTNQSYMVIPLYKLDANGGIEIDLRHIPRADAWSLNLTSGSAS